MDLWLPRADPSEVPHLPLSHLSHHSFVAANTLTHPTAGNSINKTPSLLLLLQQDQVPVHTVPAMPWPDVKPVEWRCWSLVPGLFWNTKSRTAGFSTSSHILTSSPTQEVSAGGYRQRAQAPDSQPKAHCDKLLSFQSPALLSQLTTPGTVTGSKPVTPES